MEETTLMTRDGTELFIRFFDPEEPRASLILVHGTGEHGGMYEEACLALSERGIAVLAYDCRGAGRSAGRRMYISRWEEYRSDLAEVMFLQKRRYFHLPVFLLGFSMGGTVVLDFALGSREKSAGVIASSPGLGTDNVPPFLVMVSSLISKLFPALRIDIGLKSDYVSREEQVVRRYDEDPLCDGRVTARWGSEMIKAQKRLLAGAPDFPTPLLIAYGSGDKMVPLEPISLFYEKAASDDKTLKVYPDAYHNLINDSCGDEVRRDYARWILERV